MIRTSPSKKTVAEKISPLPAHTQIDGVLCRGARSMLGLSQHDLSVLTGLSRFLLNEFESGARAPKPGNVVIIRDALETCGASFFDCGDGTVAVRIARAGSHAEAS